VRPPPPGRSGLTDASVVLADVEVPLVAERRTRPPPDHRRAAAALT
jgi:hypothetical protein